MSDVKNAYQRTNYWLNYIASQLKKVKPQQRQQESDKEDLAKEIQALRQEQQSLREEVRALREERGNGSGDPLDPADFDEHGLGYRNQQLDGQGRLTFEVQHYPTGRNLGQVRVDGRGEWESMSYTQDGEHSWQKLPADWAGPEGSGTRDLAGQHVATTHAGAVEARLIHQGVEVDPATAYDLEQLHNADNALYHGVAVQRVNQYLKDHQSRDFQGNENSVHVDVVPHSTVWNVSPAPMHAEIMESSPWAQEKAAAETPAQPTPEVDPVDYAAAEQARQQAEQNRQPQPEGAGL